jgi:hypothetical protein
MYFVCIISIFNDTVNMNITVFGIVTTCGQVCASYPKDTVIRTLRAKLQISQHEHSLC